MLINQRSVAGEKPFRQLVGFSQNNLTRWAQSILSSGTEWLPSSGFNLIFPISRRVIKCLLWLCKYFQLILVALVIVCFRISIFRFTYKRDISQQLLFVFPASLVIEL